MKKFFSKVIHKVTNLVMTGAHACAELAGVAAARYRADWEADNQRRAAEAHAVQEQQTRTALQPEYDFVAEMLTEALNNTADATHFRTVPFVSRVKLRDCLGCIDGIWLMQFRARRFRGYSVTAKDAQRILQAEIDYIREYNGYPRLLLHVAFAADGAVKIKVGPAAELMRRHAERVNFDQDDPACLRDYGPHRVWTLQAHIPDGVYVDRHDLLKSLTDHLDEQAELPSAVRFRAYNIELYHSPYCGDYVFASIYHTA